MNKNGKKIKNILLYEPIVPNKIADKYIPAYYQNIEGFLGYRMKVNHEKRLLQIDADVLLSGFKNRPGSQVWIGEHVGKFLFSASNVYKYSNDATIKQLMDGMVKEYIACQLADGYLGTYLPEDYWTEWDVWAHKYAIIGLLGYYSVTGFKPAIEAAQKAADLICRTFGNEEGKKDIITAGHHAGMAPGSILEPMVDLYRYTGEKKYLDFCEYILSAYEQPNGPKIMSGLGKHGNVTKVGNAKAYEMLSCFLGILKYYKLAGDEKLLQPLQTAWLDIQLRRMYVTGTTSEHERFKEDYVLPAENSNNMGEGCVTTTWIQFNLQLLQLTGEPKYVEELERSVYNHLFAAENPQTGCVSYYTPLQGIKPYKCDQGYSCCLSSVPRGISLIPDMVWGKVDNVFSILLYESGEVTDTIWANDRSSIELNITATTSFPLDGNIEYIITPAATKSFILNFRVPEWSQNFVAKTKEKTYKGITGKFLPIERTWKAGDKLEVSFDMPVKLTSGGISYPNKIAFKKGPQVLAVDQALNVENFPINNLQLAGDNFMFTDAKDMLPLNWDWKQAYMFESVINHTPKKVIVVPYSEAGQNGTEINVWIDSPNYTGKST